MQGNSTTVGYSYIRFSSKKQEEGDSIRRQTAGAAKWAEENSIALDKSLKIDKGVSAFKGKHRENPDLNGLAAFLRLVESGRVAKGSFLIVESLDRLTREDIQPALLLILNLLQCEIRIVQLKPVEIVYDDKSEAHTIMLMVVELMRGNSESKMKSERVGKTWGNKKQAARNGGNQPPRKKDGRVTESLTDRLPAWVEDRNGKKVSIPAAAKAVKRIFELARTHGIPSIIKKLDEEKVPPIGRTGKWTRSYVGVILKDRRAMGELQPKKGKKADGAPIPNYYPAIVTEQEWLAARAGAKERGTNPGRIGEVGVNIFAGLLKHGRDGDSYIMTQRFSKSPTKETTKYAVLINSKADVKSGQRAYSIPYDPFETAILSCLKEIDPHEILNGDTGPDETITLAGEFAGLEAELAEASAFMEANGFSPTIGKRIATLEARKTEVANALKEARLIAEHPLSETWGESKTLIGALANATDQRDIRLRLRSAIRRMVESIWLVIIPRGKYRLCAVQIHFKKGEATIRREYLILYCPAQRSFGRPTPATLQTYSFADIADADDLDLRRKKDVRDLTRTLESLNLDTIS